MRNVWISGGAGSLGRAVTGELLKDPCIERIAIYSRDEAKHQDMNRQYPEYPDNRMRYLLGDICDHNRTRLSMARSDVVIHAAAMKMIDTCEYNPTESTRINVEGSLSVFRSCQENGAGQCLFVSSDKAVRPLSIYGAQKAVSEHAAIGFNNLCQTCNYNVVRYGNVWASNKSFIHTWEALAAAGKPIQVTNPDMTRFFWSIGDAARFIVQVITDVAKYNERGCIYVPKMRSYSLMDIAKTISDKIEISSIRCPEKLHEDLITTDESPYTYDCGNYYVIYPSQHQWSKNENFRGTKVEKGFSLTSGTAPSGFIRTLFSVASDESKA